MGLIIRSSSIHAAGCYTTTSIAKGTRVVEYTGPIITKDEGDRRYEDKPITYLFGIGDGTNVIDGHGTAMFINHSCAANCETEEIDDRIWITAIRDIAAGEELCYDYCLYDGDEEEAPCNCGAATCRGSMFSEEVLEERAAKKKAAKKGAKKKSAPKKMRKQADPAPQKSAVKKATPEKTAQTAGKSIPAKKNAAAKPAKKRRRG